MLGGSVLMESRFSMSCMVLAGKRGSFYFAGGISADAIEVLHVLHGARDIHHLLSAEFRFAVDADEPMDSGGA